MVLLKILILLLQDQNLKDQDFDQRFFENLLVIINDNKLFVTDLDLKNFIDKNKDFFEIQ